MQRERYKYGNRLVSIRTRKENNRRFIGCFRYRVDLCVHSKVKDDIHSSAYKPRYLNNTKGKLFMHKK